MLTVRGGLSFVVVMSICSVFDVKDTTASLRRVLKTLTDRREEGCLRRLHEEAHTQLDLAKALARLRQQQERLNSRKLGEALARMKDLRDKELAHLDVTANFARGNLTLVISTQFSPLRQTWPTRPRSSPSNVYWILGALMKMPVIRLEISQPLGSSSGSATSPIGQFPPA